MASRIALIVAGALLGAMAIKASPDDSPILAFLAFLCGGFAVLPDRKRKKTNGQIKCRP